MEASEIEINETPTKYAHIQYTGEMQIAEHWADYNPQQAWAWTIIHTHMRDLFSDEWPVKRNRSIEQVLETLDWLKARSDKLDKIEDILKESHDL